MSRVARATSRPRDHDRPAPAASKQGRPSASIDNAQPSSPPGPSSRAALDARRLGLPGRSRARPKRRARRPVATRGDGRPRCGTPVCTAWIPGSRSAGDLDRRRSRPGRRITSASRSEPHGDHHSQARSRSHRQAIGVADDDVPVGLGRGRIGYPVGPSLVARHRGPIAPLRRGRCSAGTLARRDSWADGAAPIPSSDVIGRRIGSRYGRLVDGCIARDGGWHPRARPGDLRRRAGGEPRGPRGRVLHADRHPTAVDAVPAGGPRPEDHVGGRVPRGAGRWNRYRSGVGRRHPPRDVAPQLGVGHRRDPRMAPGTERSSRPPRPCRARHASAPRSETSMSLGATSASGRARSGIPTTPTTPTSSRP